MKFARTLDVPQDAVTQKIAFLGRTGSGKSYAADKLIELMLYIRAQVVIVDPVGIHYGLRLDASGKRPSRYQIPVLGGLHGDIPLEPTAGALIADLIVDRGISAVLDISQMTTSEQTRFALAFATRFYQRKKSSPSAVHLVLEECQEMVPQNPMRGGEEPKMLNAFERLIKLGRNFGIGVSLISQRPQEVNKKALNQTEFLLAFQMTGPQEKKSIKSWVAEKGLDVEDLDQVLPKLKVGHAHAWSPQWLEISEVVAIHRRTTFDASSTPKVGARAAVVRPLKPIDLKHLRTDMAATIERAKADDPKLLQAEIRTLKAELAKKGHRAPLVETKTITKVKPVRVPFVKPRQIRAMKGFIAAAKDASTAAQTMERIVLKIERAGSEVIRLEKTPLAAKPSLFRAPEEVVESLQNRVREMKATAVRRVSREAPKAKVLVMDEKDLGKGARSVMIAIAQYVDGVNDGQLAVLTGYKRSTRDAYISRLKSAGYVDRSNGQTTVTQAGLEWLGEDFEPLPTGEALQEYWLAKLPEGEKRILECAILRFPGAVKKDHLEDLTGFKRSTRDAYISRLLKKRVVTTTAKEVFAAKELFS